MQCHAVNHSQAFFNPSRKCVMIDAASGITSKEKGSQITLTASNSTCISAHIRQNIMYRNIFAVFQCIDSSGHISTLCISLPQLVFLFRKAPRHSECLTRYTDISFAEFSAYSE